MGTSSAATSHSKCASDQIGTCLGSGAHVSPDGNQPLVLPAIELAAQPSGIRNERFPDDVQAKSNHHSTHVDVPPSGIINDHAKYDTVFPSRLPTRAFIDSEHRALANAPKSVYDVNHFTEANEPTTPPAENDFDPGGGTTTCPACGKSLKVLTISHHTRSTCRKRDMITSAEHARIAAMYREAMRLYMRRRNSGQVRRSAAHGQLSPNRDVAVIAKHKPRSKLSCALTDASRSPQFQNDRRETIRDPLSSMCNLPARTITDWNEPMTMEAAEVSLHLTSWPDPNSWFVRSTSEIGALVRAHADQNPISFPVPAWLSRVSCRIGDIPTRGDDHREHAGEASQRESISNHASKRRIDAYPGSESLQPK